MFCSLKLGTSLFQALLNHLGSGIHGHALAFPVGRGSCQWWDSEGLGIPLTVLCRGDGDREDSLFACWRVVSMVGLKCSSLHGWGAEALGIPAC